MPVAQVHDGTLRGQASDIEIRVTGIPVVGINNGRTTRKREWSAIEEGANAGKVAHYLMFKGEGVDRLPGFGLIITIKNIEK